MKRTATFVLIIVCIISMFPAVAYADNPETVIMLENGDYITVTKQESPARASGTKTGSRTQTYVTSDGTTAWQAVLTATFSYNGATSSCTSSNCSVNVYSSSWYLVSKSATKSGNTATATFTMGYRVLGVTASKPTYQLSLSCDKNGNLT